MQTFKKNKITTSSKTDEIPQIIRKSSHRHKKQVNMISSGHSNSSHYHLNAITNPAFLAKKNICKKCGISFRRNETLRRHCLSKTCLKKNKFISNKIQQFPLTIKNIMLKHMPNSMMVTDKAYIFLQASHTKDHFQVMINFVKNGTVSWKKEFLTII